jgi:hypothetical protein
MILLGALGARGQFVQEQKMLPAVRKAKSGFGRSVAINGNVMAVGCPEENNNFGAVYLFENQNGTWVQTHRLVSPDAPSWGDWFGYAIAWAGDDLIIAAPIHDAFSPTYVDNAGLVFVFRKQSAHWGVVQRIAASDPQESDGFGYSLAISGNRLVVGAANKPTDVNGNNPILNAGAAYVFENNGTSWGQVQKLTAPERKEYDAFGQQVAIEGNTLLVYAIRRNDDQSKSQAGVVYVFEKDATEWKQSQQLLAPDRSAGDFFGGALAMSGSTLFVGAKSQDFDATGANPIGDGGGVYVFEKGNAGWLLSQKLVASDRGIATGLGWSLAVSGNLLFTGSSSSTDADGANFSPGAGAVYLFEKGNTGWIQTQKIVAPDRLSVGNYPAFGSALAVQDQRVVIAAGSEGLDDSDAENTRGAGSVYTFTRSSTNPNPGGCGLTKVRVFPRPDCCSGRTLGGQVQVSTEGKSGPWQTILTINQENAGQWSEFTVNAGNGAYKAIRYLAPNWGYGNVAELEFYNGNQKLGGNVFADDGGPWNGQAARAADKAFDGNTQSFYDANNANGAFVGLELTSCGEPPVNANDCALTKLRLFPRPDCCSGRTLGGQVQVSTEGKNGPYQTILTINQENAGQWLEVNLINLNGPYKAIRYVSPNGGYTNLAELEIYRGNQKLTGTVFSDPGGPWNGLQDRAADKVFDGNVNTYYDSNNGSGGFVGLELATCGEVKPGCALTEVRVLPRLDCCAGRTIGGQIQVSFEGKNGPWSTVLGFDTEVSGQSRRFFVPTALNSVKAVRYAAPDWSYGNVAELEFYNGTQKLTGTVFADPGGPWNGLQDRTADKAFDGDPSTFYDANNANGAYVGLELTGCSSGTNRLAASEAETAELKWSLQVAPNPSSGRVKARVKLPQAGTFTLTLTNALGQELHRRRVTGEAGENTIEVDVSAQPTGLYLLRVQTEGQKPLVQKLLKHTE